MQRSEVTDQSERPCRPGVCACACARTAAELPRLAAQRDDLHPLLAVEVEVQLLGRQLQAGRRAFGPLLAAPSLHAGRHHPHPPAARLFGLMDEPRCRAWPLLALWGHHHQVSCPWWGCHGPGAHGRQRLPKERDLLRDGELGEAGGGADGDGGGRRGS